LCDDPCPADCVMYIYADYIFYFFDGCEFMSNTQTQKYTQKYTYIKEYRNTQYGGYTKYIAVCFTCKKVVKPTSVRRSKSGTHGEDYYTHEHPLEFLLLYSSNRGNRSIAVPSILEPIKEQLEIMWIYENCSVHMIIEFINSYLSKL